MKVKDIMTRQVFSVDKDESLGFVLDQMRAKGLTKVPVTEGGNIAGIVTDGDIANELGAIRSRGVESMNLHVTAAMRRDVPTVTPDTDIEKVLDILLMNGHGIVPVIVDAKVVGVVTQADLLPLVKSDALVKDFMVKELYAVKPQDRVIHARRVMLDHGVERLPVLDGGRLVGIVGEMDVALGYAKFKEAFKTQHQDHRIKQFFVQDIMHRDVVTGLPEMTAREAAERMQAEHVGGLPVVNGADRIAGIVTQTDLLRFVSF